jgi:hypothetical protein
MGPWDNIRGCKRATHTLDLVFLRAKDKLLQACTKLVEGDVESHAGEEFISTLFAIISIAMVASDETAEFESLEESCILGADETEESKEGVVVNVARQLFKRSRMFNERNNLVYYGAPTILIWLMFAIWSDDSAAVLEQRRKTAFPFCIRHIKGENIFAIEKSGPGAVEILICSQDSGVDRSPMDESYVFVLTGMGLALNPGGLCWDLV